MSDYFLNSKILKYYTQGALLNGQPGAVVVGMRSGNITGQGSYHVGSEKAVFNTESYEIAKATKFAVKQTANTTHLTSNVTVYCNNQAAVQRMSKSTAEPGQQLVIQARNKLLTLQELRICCNIHWVPGHVDVKGTKIGDTLAK